MIAIPSKQSGASTKSAHCNQFFLTPNLSLPYRMRGTCSSMPCNFEMLRFKPLSVHIRDFPSKLRNPSHNRPSGSHIHTIMPTRCIINGTKPTICQLSNYFPNHGIVIKRAVDHPGNSLVKVILINICQWCHNKLAISIIHVKAHGLSDISEFIIALLNKPLRELLQFLIFFVRNIFRIYLLINIFISDIFPINYLVV